MTVDLAIVGGGASGMMAGIIAARSLPGIKAVILERMDRPGKKLLATGNGRCNYTNKYVSLNNYHGNSPQFAKYALDIFTNEDTISFFRDLGVVARIENEGKVFPYSGNASAVLDALRFELDSLNIPVHTMFCIKTIKKEKNRFSLIAENGERLVAKKVIVATGGKASPALGSDGSGFDLLVSVGHECTRLSPAITHILTSTKDVKPLQGIKFLGSASAIYHGKVIATLEGEVLFTSIGLSGPPIFQLSCLVANKLCDEIWLDLMPQLHLKDVADLLIERKTKLANMTMERYFSGLLNKRIGNLISRRAGIVKLSLPVSDLSYGQIHEMAKHIKSLRFAVEGLNSWKYAQVTAGGISTNDFNSKTMESKLVPGLYAIGEVVDIFGDCGGYNLQWAWSSGYLAGKSAAQSLAYSIP
jgi:predicted Rossmann fold flavoprotein